MPRGICACMRTCTRAPVRARGCWATSVSATRVHSMHTRYTCTCPHAHHPACACGGARPPENAYAKSHPGPALAREGVEKRVSKCWLSLKSLFHLALHNPRVVTVRPRGARGSCYPWRPGGGARAHALGQNGAHPRGQCGTHATDATRLDAYNRWWLLKATECWRGTMA